MVTNAEYQKASKSLNEQYTADSLQNYQTAYNDYKAQGMSTTDAVNKAKGLLVANEQATPRDTGDTGGVKETIVDENINDETIKQETPIEQGENIGSTGGEIKQEGELKPLSQEYYNQTSDNAQNVIRNNLNGYRQSNPELFSDYETFKKNFSYDARDDVQKNTLDNWYKGYEKGLQLSTIPVNELYTQYKDGSISLSDLENLRISNPSKYNELQEQINKGNIISAYDDDKGTTEDSLQDMAYNAAMQMFTKWMSGESSSGASQIFADYEAKMNNPEMLELSDNCTEVQEQMENIQADIDSMKKQVEAEFAGKGASRSKINAIIADRTYDLQLQLRTLNSEYSKYATQYNNRMQQYQNEFNMQLQEYQINQQARSQQMQELGFALDLMNFETNEQKAQREWDYWVKQQEYQNGNINSKDYQTRYKAALTSVQNLLSQYEGIPMERSAEQMAQDVLKAIEGGSDLGTELTKINKQIQQKPEYKYLYNNTYGKGNDISYQTFKLGDQEYIVYNNELMSSDEFNKKYGGKAIGATGEAKPYDIVDASVFDLGNGFQTKAGTLGAFLSNPNNASKKIGGWCGAFVNKYLKSIGASNQNYYDDNLETKLNSVNTKIPKVGSIAVFDYGHITEETGQNHGHVGIVTKVYSDGSFDVIESNFNGDKVIGTRQHIKPQSPSCKGFFDPSQPPASMNGEEKTNPVSDNDIYNYNDATLNRKMSAEDRQRVLDARNEIYSNPNSSMEDILRFSVGGKTPTDTTVQSLDKYAQALTSLGQIMDLLEDADTGPLIGELRSKNPYDVKAREINSAIQGLIPTLARGVYGEVGVLTDKDIEHYSKTVPNLKSTSEVNNAILAMTLDMLADGYKRKLSTQASLGYDVSGMAGIYKQITDKAEELRGVSGAKYSSDEVAQQINQKYHGGDQGKTVIINGAEFPSEFPS